MVEGEGRVRDRGLETSRLGGVLLSKSGGGRERGGERLKSCERWGRAGTKKETDGYLGYTSLFLVLAVG